MPDYKKEWLQQADINYFAPFINLWLACNSWYRSHYSDINGSDRALINKIKSDFTDRNHLFINFKRLVDTSAKEGINFRTNLELLHYALESVALQPDKIRVCSLKYAVTNYDNPDATIDLIKNPRVNQDGSIHAADTDAVTKLDSIYIDSNKEDFFAGLFEIIYQVRCLLVHGNLKPEKSEHDVVKYCYSILSDLMTDS